MGIMRKRRGWDFFRFEETRTVLWFARDYDELVLPVTDNWVETGRPVDWGIEPLLTQIQKIDGWRDDTDYDRFCEDRESRKRNKDRAWRNDVRALAADARKDFARAVNDVNTSSLEKIEKRRNSKWQ